MAIGELIVGFAEHLTAVGQRFEGRRGGTPPLLQRVVQSETQTVGIVPTESHTDGLREREDVAQSHRVAGLHRVTADALVVKFGAAVKSVAEPVDDTERNLVTASDAVRPLSAEVQRVGTHLVGIGATERIGGRIAELRVSRVRGGAPQIAGIRPDRKAVQRHEAQSGIDLMQTAFARVACRRGQRARSATPAQTRALRGQLVAHTAEGAQAETKTQTRCQSETCGEVVELRAIIVARGIAGRTMLGLQGHADVEHEAQRVETRIRCRICEIQTTAVA